MSVRLQREESWFGRPRLSWGPRSRATDWRSCWEWVCLSRECFERIDSRPRATHCYHGHGSSARAGGRGQWRSVPCLVALGRICGWAISARSQRIMAGAQGRGALNAGGPYLDAYDGLHYGVMHGSQDRNLHLAAVSSAQGRAGRGSTSPGTIRRRVTRRDRCRKARNPRT